jgi:predicted Zn-dependent protease
MRAAIAQRPDYAAAYFMLGTVLKQKGQLAAAEEPLRTAIRLTPDDPGPYNTLAQVLRQMGDIAGSKQMFAEGARVKQLGESKLGVMLGR